jgi:carbon storage regulator
MLVLTRRVGEAILLSLPDGQKIRILCVEMERKKVRIGVEAPKEINIIREELQKPDEQNTLPRD